MKFATKPMRYYPPPLGMLLHYLGTLSIQIFCRYSAGMAEMQTSCILIASNFVIHPRINIANLSPYWLQIKFLSKSCPRRWIPCWLLTDTAVASAVTNFRCHKLVAEVIKEKNSDIKKFICNQYEERLAVLNTENLKICEWITKWQRIKMHFVCIFFHICWISAENLNF